MLCGYRCDRAMAAWGRCDGQTLVRALGVTQDKTPWAATLYVEGGGDHVMVVKANQPRLHQDTHLPFHDVDAAAERMVATDMVDVGHGRIEQRRLTPAQDW